MGHRPWHGRSTGGRTYFARRLPASERAHRDADRLLARDCETVVDAAQARCLSPAESAPPHARRIRANRAFPVHAGLDRKSTVAYRVPSRSEQGRGTPHAGTRSVRPFPRPYGSGCKQGTKVPELATHVRRRATAPHMQTQGAGLKVEPGPSADFGGSAPPRHSPLRLNAETTVHSSRGVPDGDPALYRRRLPSLRLAPCRNHSGTRALRPGQALRQTPEGCLASALAGIGNESSAAKIPRLPNAYCRSVPPHVRARVRRLMSIRFRYAYGNVQARRDIFVQQQVSAFRSQQSPFVSTNRMSPVAGTIDLVSAPRGRVIGPHRHEIERPGSFVRRRHPGSPFEDGVQLALQRPMVAARQALERVERLGRHVPDVY